MSRRAITIREFEWEMGNGQCPCCYGIQPNDKKWERFSADETGHAPDCALAEVMKAAGLAVVIAARPEKRRSHHP